MDMETVDSTVNAQHRVNGCGQGRNEVEVVGDVGEAFSLSLSLSLSLSDWDRRRSAEPRRIPITLSLYRQSTDYHGRDYQCYMYYASIEYRSCQGQPCGTFVKLKWLLRYRQDNKKARFVKQ